MKKPDVRQEKIFRILLIGTLIISYITLIFTIFIKFDTIFIHQNRSYSINNILPAAVFTGLITFYYLLLKSYKKNIAAYLYLFTLAGIGGITSLIWGADVPISYLIYTISIVFAGIILGTQSAVIITLTISLELIIISYLQGIGYLHYQDYWLASPPALSDGLLASLIFSLIALVSWLSNREIERSLARAESSEADLIKERDLLEVRVQERTAELQKSQLEKMLQLYKFADFGKLAAGLMHDIVNPLMVVSMNLEQLEAQSSQQKSKERIAVQSSIKRASDGAKRIESYIHAARKQIQQQDVTTTFNVCKEINDMLEIFSYRIRKEHIAMNFSCQSKITLTGNPILFNQCLSNIISNALDAHKGHHSDKKMIHISVISHPKFMTLKIEDNAHGISQQNLKNIFKPLFTTKSAENGTGLGLAITNDIVQKAFHGKIDVKSKIGKGTVFTLTLPHLKELLS